MALHGLRLLAGLGLMSSWVRFCFLLLDHFLFCLGGGGAILSLALRIGFVIVACIWTWCWCIFEKSCCHACSNAAVSVVNVVVICQSSWILLLIRSISFA